MKKRMTIFVSVSVLILVFGMCVITAFANGVNMNTFKNEIVVYENVYDEYIFEYTFFPSSLINYIGEDQFKQWIESSEQYTLTDTGEVIPRNIIDCLEYFNITQKEFEEIYYTYDYYSLIYDIDVMYNGTSEEIIEYFKDFETREIESNSRINILDNKIYLRNNISKWTNNVDVIQKYYELPITAWTFTDIIYDANIPKTDMEAIIDNNKTYDYFSGKAKYNLYDLDKMYEIVKGMKDSNIMTSFNKTYNKDFDNFKDLLVFERQFIH